MGKTVRDVMVNALENLEEQSLKKFKNKLNDSIIKEGYNKIPKGKLQKADAEDTADHILSFYTDSYGIEVTLAVLEAINENQEAENLRSALKTVTRGGVPETSGAADGAAPCRPPITESGQGTASGDAEHFVVRHRAGLIGRVTLVAPILDDLYQKKLLTGEQYDRVRSIRTSQDQMRELFRYMESWGDEDKDEFVQSLRKHNLPLVRSLEGK